MISTTTTTGATTMTTTPARTIRINTDLGDAIAYVECDDIASAQRWMAENTLVGAGWAPMPFGDDEPFQLGPEFLLGAGCAVAVVMPVGCF